MATHPNRAARARAAPARRRRSPAPSAPKPGPLAQERKRALSELESRLEREDVVTITIHNDDLLWARMLRAAVHAGFTPVPGSMLMSIVNATSKGMVVTHVAHLIRALQPAAPADPSEPTQASHPKDGAYAGPEFG